MIYLITYDLHGPGRDYSNLYSEIKSLGNWWHYLDSTWFVSSELGAGAIRDSLKSKIDSNDEILVVEIGKSWASYNLDTEGVTWLKQHINNY